MAQTPPITARLPDETAERVRLNHELRISELQALPLAGARIIQAVTLVDSTPLVVAHKLGHKPLFVCPGAPRSSTTAPITGTGRIIVVAQNASTVTLEAVGWGVTILADVVVV